MVFKTLSLENVPLNVKAGKEKDLQIRVEEYLKQCVEDMIEEAEDKLTGDPNQPTKPLIRLRVEYTDESQMLSSARFGNSFYDGEGKPRVGNPADMLLFKKKVERDFDMSEANGDLDLEHMDVLRQIESSSSMEALIQQYFNTTEDEKSQLKLLGVKGIAQAVSNFIQKDDTQAINLIVDKQLEKTKKALRDRHEEMEGEDDGGDDEDVIDEALGDYRRQRAAVNEAQEAREVLDGPEGRQRGRRQQQRNDFDDFGGGMDVDDDFGDDPVLSTSKRGRGRGRGGSASTRGARGRGRGRGAKAPSIVDAFSRQSQRSNGATATPTRSPRSKRSSKVKYVVEDSDDDE